MAKSEGKELAQTLGYWFRRKYNLAPTDPRYLDATPHEMLVEYWADHYHSAPPVTEEFEDDDFDLDALVNNPDAWEDVISYGEDSSTGRS